MPHKAKTLAGTEVKKGTTVNPSKRHQRVLPFVLGTLAAVPLASVLVTTPAHAASAHKTVKSYTYKGSVVNTQWGPIQVSITVKNKRIVNAKASAPTHTARSSVLDSEALPVLRQEVLQAQSANINTVSGATTISQAYITSLQAAIVKAHL